MTDRAISRTTRPERTTPTSNNEHLRRETTLLQIELMLAAAHERQALLRSIRESGRIGKPPAPLRHRVGRSLVRLGHLVAGEPASSAASAAAAHPSTPAWSG
jgi:hypothetical protein